MSVFRSFRFRVRAVAVTAATLTASVAAAAVSPPPGYIYDALLLRSLTQNCIAAGPGGTFVGVGKGFTANAQAVVLVKESGEARLVAFGFSSIGDCAYDRSNDILYVTDNADNANLDITTGFAGNTGAQSGDTVFAIADAGSAPGVFAAGLELVPANSIEFASGVALAANGDILVTNSVGSGMGTVLRIDPTGASTTTFAGGFDFASGVAVNPANGDVFAAESLASFDNQISRYTSAGMPVSTPLVGPSFTLGSLDMVFNADGKLLSTGVFFGDVVSIDVPGATFAPFISGLTFASGITVDPFTRRIEVLSSTFTGVDEDKSLHRFTPVDALVPGGDSAKKECLNEFYGIELVPAEPGDAARNAICVDGEACDADGTVNDRCVFPIGFCVNVDDPRFPECETNNPIGAFAVSATPFSAAVAVAAQAASAALPILGPSCFYSDGVTVPVRTSPQGKRSGKARVSAKASSNDGRIDADVATLVCKPAGA